MHAEQLRHVEKGCLTRIRHDIAGDGSRIEGSHKGWNSLQRSFSCGLELFCALAHDFVLRRNIRIAHTQDTAVPFEKSTLGSHHIRLTDHIARLWNQLLKTEKKASTNLKPLPEMATVASDETFGLVVSKSVETFNGLLEIKDEEENVFDLPQNNDLDADELLQVINIDPELRFHPLAPNVSEAKQGANAVVQHLSESHQVSV